MLDHIIENIIQKIRKEVVQPGMNEIPLMYLFTRNIPDSIKHFFDQEVELWIREESEKFSSSERFDYDLPEVQMLLDKIFDTLKQTANFNLNQFNLLLERAIKLEANFLIRPQQTLSQFLFKDAPVITTIEVYDMLKYFDKFSYYKDALTDYFNLKYLREISQAQFKELIAAIDEQVYAKTPVQTAMQTVKVVNQFIDEGRSKPSEAISTRILYMVFSDRNLKKFSGLMEKEVRDGTSSLTFADLEKILSSGRTLKEQRSKPPKPEVREILDTLEPAVQVEKIVVPESPQVVEEEYEEAEEEYEEEYEEKYEEKAAEPVKPKPEPVVSKAADQLASLVADKMKGDHLEDLTNLITRWQRRRFVKKIFRKKENQYEAFIQELNGTPTWKQASNIIDTFFFQQGLNPYSKEALEFSDLVYNRYFPKDIAVNKGSEFRY